MDMANVKRMVLAHAPMDSTEIPVQVYLYHLWLVLGQSSSSEFKNFMTFLSIILHQAKNVLNI